MGSGQAKPGGNGWWHVIAAHCPQAVRAADPYHVVTWATEALDEQRRIAWNTARGGPGR